MASLGDKLIAENVAVHSFNKTKKFATKNHLLNLFGNRNRPIVWQKTSCCWVNL